ncbi:MAG: DUF3800 domain-containing protein [Pyrinomonadaceae bacterium]|nr:DUF3800 domain-containing protein [Pyrinomonadaceae bacterium]
MIWGYMDETGHSKDERQRFNGMAGLIAPADHWEQFERDWKRTLRKAHVPYFHMKDFEHSEKAAQSTKSKNPFKGWKPADKERLFAKLLKHMQDAHAFPLGASLCMDDFRRLTPAQQAMFDDPYYMGFCSTLAYASGFLDKVGAASTERAAIIFDNQVEFRHRALEFFEKAYNQESFIKRRINSPNFGDMREVVPLQAADIVAYELYKEHDRRLYRPDDPIRNGYHVLLGMGQTLGFPPLFRFRSAKDLHEDVKAIEAEHRRIAYWRKRKAAKSKQSEGSG